MNLADRPHDGCQGQGQACRDKGQSADSEIPGAHFNNTGILGVDGHKDFRYSKSDYGKNQPDNQAQTEHKGDHVF